MIRRNLQCPRASRLTLVGAIGLSLAAVVLSACMPGWSAGDAPPATATTVMSVDTYAVSKSTHIYARGLTHEDWGDSEGTAINLRLDLYIPKGAPGLHPAAIFIHGGGFIGGSRHHGALSEMAEALAARGWVCVSVDYRLAGARGTVPDEWMQTVDTQPLTDRQHEQGLAIYAASRDVKAAVRWLTARADALSIDTTRITALGGSAGAVLAVMLGVTEPEDFRDEIVAHDDPTLLTTNLNASSDVQSVVDFWGNAVAVQLLEDIFGVKRFDSTDAPLLIIHGTRDQTVSYDKAIELEEIWTSTGVPFESHALVGKGHAAWDATIEGQPLVEIAFDFIVRQQGLIVED